MPRKKKDKPEAIWDSQNPKDETISGNGSPPEAGSAASEAEHGEILEGAASPKDDAIPPEEKISLLQAALETSEAKAGEYLEGWQRAQAEFTNYRKRQEREYELVRFEAVGRVIKRFLPIADDMQRALKDRPVQGDDAPWAEGVELIYRKLMAILEAEGVTLIEAEGQMFDPNLHEAVVQSESETHESGIVIEVLQAGYKLGERVLRPAMVRVAA